MIGSLPNQERTKKRRKHHFPLIYQAASPAFLEPTRVSTMLKSHQRKEEKMEFGEKIKEVRREIT